MKYFNYWACAIAIALLYKRNFSKFEHADNKFIYEVALSPRWYSPFFWALSLIMLIWCIYDGGVKKYLKDLKLEFKDENQEIFEGVFNGDVPVWKQKLLLWRFSFIGP